MLLDPRNGTFKYVHSEKQLLISVIQITLTAFPVSQRLC